MLPVLTRSAVEIQAVIALIASIERRCRKQPLARRAALALQGDLGPSQVKL